MRCALVDLKETRVKTINGIFTPAALAALVSLGVIGSGARPAIAAQTPAPAAAAKPDIEPAAMTALAKMGEYLRSLKAFQVNSVSGTDDVTEDGQLIENDAVTDILSQPPNRLRVEVTSDAMHRLYFYNGKVLTVWAELAGYYATVPAPATVGELADTLQNKFGIELPLEDLFFWGTPRAATNKITAAFDAGPSQVGRVTCEQYVFRQEGMDWQIWIQNGDYPLPRKLVLTTTTDPARPRHSMVLTWNLAPSFNETAFVFDPPKDAHKITLAEIRQAAGDKK
jgi:hypothetical protein